MNRFVMPGDEIVIAESGTVKHFTQKPHRTGFKKMKRVAHIRNGVTERIYMNWNPGYGTWHQIR